MTDKDHHKDFTTNELGQLLQSVYDRFGFDFRSYSKAHLKRRIASRLHISGLQSISELEREIMASDTFAMLFFKDLSINVTEMYRDPTLYLAIREKVIPRLKTYSFFKTWHAGCSTGQEVYSMAILFKEEGLYDRSLIYATDFNQAVLDQAKEGIYPDEDFKQYAKNHQQAGGTASLSDYYHCKYNRVIMDHSLKKKILWANHNLVTDSVFAEVQLIFCRNVLIYFDRELQNRVLELFYESLSYGGFLCLGAKESLQFSSVAHKYAEVDKHNRIYIKKY